MKKIMFMIPNLGGGGAEKVLVDILNHLDSQQFDITLILLQRDGIYLTQVAPHIKIISLQNSHPLLNWVQSRIIKYVPRFYYRLKIKSKYDVEIAFLEGMSTQLIAHSSNTKSKKIAWVHTNLLHNHWTKNMFILGKERRSYATYDQLVFVSKQACEGFSEFLKGIIVPKQIICNPLFQDKVCERAQEDKIEFDLPTVVAVGRLSQQKGFDLLIKAHAKVCQTYKHQLLIIGEGKELEPLQRLIKELNVGESVKLLGFITNPYPYMLKADFIVSSSRIEGYPMVLLESLALHKPILATKITGNNEILNEGEFALMCEVTVESLATGLVKLLTEPEVLDYYTLQSAVRANQLQADKIIMQIQLLLHK